MGMTVISDALKCATLSLSNVVVAAGSADL